MKHCLILGLLLCIVFGCKVKGPVEYIQLDHRIASLSFKGETDIITVQVSKGEPWKAVTQDAWIEVRILTENTFSVTAGVNQTTKPRKGEVVVSTAGAADILTVIQNVDPAGVPLQTLDSLALVALYDQTGGEHWYFKHDEYPESLDVRWNLQKPFRTWAGVSCDYVEGQYRVIRLDITARGATGNLPPDFNYLTLLSEFVASGNQLSSEALKSLCAMTKLRRLDLRYNDFQGTIPGELALMADLEILRLDGNLLTGDIPSLSMISGLKWFSVASNQLSLTIENLCGNTALVYLDLSDNQIQGSIPPAMANLVNLVQLDLSTNHLTGEIPRFMGAMQSLYLLKLASNQLQGVIPAELGQLNVLETANLSENRLTAVEAGAFTSPKLLTLDLSFNSIATVAMGLENLTALETLNVSNNNITRIDGDLSTLTKLETLQLSDNQLKSLPQGVNTLPNLQMITASHNQLIALPDFGQAVSLAFADFSSNQLREGVPIWIGALPLLRTINLANNNMVGTLPATLVNNQVLRSIDVSGNKLSGQLPKQILTDVRYTGQTITVPQEDPPYALIELFIPPIWDPVRQICPQQSGVGFTNCGHVSHDPDYGNPV